MDAFKVSKAGDRFVTFGKIAIIAGRTANEPYSKVHKTRKAAEADAAKWDRINAEALAEHASTKKARKVGADAHLAARAVRPAAAQLGFDF